MSLVSWDHVFLMCDAVWFEKLISFVIGIHGLWLPGYIYIYVYMRD